MNPVKWGIFRSTWSRMLIQCLLLWIPLSLGMACVSMDVNTPEDATAEVALAVVATLAYAIACSFLLNSILSFGHELQYYQLFQFNRMWPLGLRVHLPSLAMFIVLGPALFGFALAFEKDISNGWMYGINLSAVALFFMAKFFIASTLEGSSRPLTILAYIMAPGLLLRRSPVPVWIPVIIVIALGYMYSYLRSYNQWSFLPIGTLLDSVALGIVKLKSAPVIGPLLLFWYLPFYLLNGLHHPPDATLIPQLAFAGATLIVVAFAVRQYRTIVQIDLAARYRDFYAFMKAMEIPPPPRPEKATEDIEIPPAFLPPMSGAETEPTPPPLPKSGADNREYPLPMDYPTGEEFLRQMELAQSYKRPFWREIYRAIGIAALIITGISLLLIWPMGLEGAMMTWFGFIAVVWAVFPAYAIPEERMSCWITPQDFWRSLWFKIKTFHLPMLPGDIALMIIGQITINTNWKSIIACTLSLFLFRLYAMMFGLIYRAQNAYTTIICLFLWIPVIAMAILPWVTPQEEAFNDLKNTALLTGVVMLPHILGWALYLLATWWRFRGVFHVDKPR